VISLKVWYKLSA